MFQEFWLEPGETAADIKEGWKKVMVNPYFATILTVVLGILLGMNGYGKIWDCSELPTSFSRVSAS